MTIKKSFAIFGTLAISVFVLAACKSEEQGRITQYKPGVYLGKPDTKLSAEQVRQLAQRSSMQGNPIYRPSGGGSTGKQGVILPSITRGQKQGNP